MRTVIRLHLLLIAILLLFLAAPRLAVAEQKPVSFSRDVAPVLVKQCQTCHGPEKSKGKFRLDTFARLMSGGKSKEPSITPGSPDKSQVYKLITSHDEDERMPQKADALPAATIEMIRTWIEQGAKFDGTDATASLSAVIGDPGNPKPPEVYSRPVPITALAFSPDGKILAASGYHEITLWDPSDGKLLGRLQNVARRTQDLAWSPDGHWLAAASGTPGLVGELRLFDMAGDRSSKVLERISDMVCAVRFSPDGTRLAAGGADNAVHIYDVASGKQELRIEQNADWVTDVAFSPDGSKIACASRDKSCRIFDAKTGAPETAFLDSEEMVYAIAWSEDGKRLFSAGRELNIRNWNASDAKAGSPITGIQGDVFRLLCNGDTLFAACGDGVVRAYSIKNRSLIRSYSRLPDWTYSLAIDSKNRRIAAGCFSGQVRVWDADDEKELLTFVAAPGNAGAIVPSQ